MQLVMELPNKETPGFLRRSKQALDFSERLKAKTIDAQVFNDIVEFFLPYVKEPADRDQAREALWDASQEQFEKVLEALTGGGTDTVNPPSAEG